MTEPKEFPADPSGEGEQISEDATERRPAVESPKIFLHQNYLALAGLVCGISGFCLLLASSFLEPLFWLLPVFAVILSTIGLVKTRNRGIRGNTIAIFGVYLGLATLASMIIIFLQIVIYILVR